MDPEQDHSAESGSFGKIRAGVMKVKKGIDGKWQIFITATKPKHLDFVLFDKKSHAVVAVIELDDLSYQLPERREIDQFVNVISKSTLALIRIQRTKAYDPDQIKVTVEQAILENRSGAPELLHLTPKKEKQPSMRLPLRMRSVLRNRVPRALINCNILVEKEVNYEYIQKHDRMPGYLVIVI